MYFFRSNGKSTFEQKKIIAALVSITARDLLSMMDDELEDELGHCPCLAAHRRQRRMRCRRAAAAAVR